jgi:hypothetical protein
MIDLLLFSVIDLLIFSVAELVTDPPASLIDALSELVRGEDRRSAARAAPFIVITMYERISSAND